MERNFEIQSKYFEALFVNSPIAIVTLDSQHKVVSINPAFEELFGYALEELMGEKIDDFIAVGTSNAEAKSYSNIVQQGGEVKEQGKRIRKDGRSVDVEIRGVPIVIEGEQVGALGMYSDITDRIKTQRKLEQSQAKYKSLFDHSPIALWEEDWSEVRRKIITLHKEGINDLSAYLFENREWLSELAETIVAKNFNLAAERLFEAKSNRELVGNFSKTFTDSSFVFFIDTLCAFYRGDHRWIADTEMMTLEGNRINLSMLASIPPIADDSWSVIYFSGLNITETKILQDQLAETLHKTKILATTDELTGLLNRRAITEKIQEEIARSIRQKSHFCLAIIDVDGFKEINDELGHLAGDEALKVIAEEIASNVREYDQVGRWGGDEFLVLMPGVDSRSLKPLAERICKSISGTVLHTNGEENLDLSISMGLCIFEGASNHVDLDELISKADVALYKAKELGGNQYVI